MKKLMIAASVAALAAVTAGCGENKPVAYKQGHYQGKVDGTPWENDRFKGDKIAWENAIKARNRNQNEYARETN